MSDSMSDAKNDTPGSDGKLKRKDYERELARTAGIGGKLGVLNHAIEQQDRVDSCPSSEHPRTAR